VDDALLRLLVDPQSGGPLTLASGTLEEGLLSSIDGATHPIHVGIPRFTNVTTTDQRRTEETFAFKWARREAYASAGAKRLLTDWLVAKYGFADRNAMRDHFSGMRILDAGCGAGFSSSAWLDEQWHGVWVGVDISTAVDVAWERLGGFADTHFVQADLLALPFAPETFDAIFSEGVLHHTPSTEQALGALVPLLRLGGEILFYVYRRKAPMREFTDDHVRALVSKLPPNEAWEALRPVTELGRALAALQVEVDVPEVPVLGIAAGRYDVQRLIYWNFAKLFWNDDLSFEENLHVNFDWYHPRYAHRQTEDEVRSWCGDLGLEIVHFDVQESGLTVRAVRS
jgi:SAM-dependent methyltransferase